ncbi:MAG: 30S ribosomal protein S8 [Clostridiales bacterium]|nr:30S ribosomal protein S8 [Clostridiales bacterium]
MVTTDPIADLLTRIRNAITARHDTVSIPASKMKKAIVDILVDEGFVASGEVVEEQGHNNIKVVLKYSDNRNAITNLKRISKPGLRVYCGCEDLPKVLGGYGIAIISTSRGVMTDKKARELKVGGEVLAYVW